MAWYKTGTVSVTNGSPTVTGSGTSWVAGAAIGEAFLAPDGNLYEIADVASNTSITLASNYMGSTLGGQSYVIVPTQSYIRDLAASAAQLVSDYASVASNAGAGKFGDGSLSAPGLRFTADENTGFRRAGTDDMRFVAGGADQAAITASGLLIADNKLRITGSADATKVALFEVDGFTTATTRTFTLPNYDATLATLAGAETLTNKTLTAPTITGAGTAAFGALSATSFSNTGNTTLGDAAGDSVQINGYAGIGGAAATDRGLYVRNSALSGTAQFGVLAEVTNTAGGTSQLTSFYSTPVAANTVTTVRHYYAGNATGAGSVTSQVGLDVLDLTKGATNIGAQLALSSGANKWNLYAIGTANNYMAGALGIGTNTPDTILHLNANNASIKLSEVDTYYGSITVDSGGGLTFAADPGNAAANSRMIFSVDGTTRMRIEPTGVAIGMTPVNEFEVYGTSSPRIALRAPESLSEVLEFMFQVGDSGANASTNTLAGIQAVQTQVTPSALIADLAFLTNAGDSVAERMRLTGVGNLGLGVTPSAWSSSTKAIQFGLLGALNARTAGAGTYLSDNAYFSGDPASTASNGVYLSTTLASTYRQGAGAHAWYTAASGTAGNPITFTQAMMLDASGNLGIGITPAVRLHSGGTSNGATLELLRLTNVGTGANTASQLTFYAAGSNYAQITGGYGAASPQLTYNVATGGYHAWAINGVEQARLNSSGDVLVTGAGGLGYGTGSGGAVTQTTSRTTGVPLDKTNGSITLVSAAGSTSWQSFTVTNNKVAATDNVIVVQKSGTDLYEIHVTNVATGSFRISFRTTGGTTTEQPVFSFSVIKAVAA